MTPATTAIFFDVDFTLIYPKSTFDVGGYQSFGARHGLSVSLDPERFTAAIATASTELDRGDDLVHRSEPFVRFARRVLEEMGGQGPGLDTCAREIYEEWAECRHFSLYDDVKSVLSELHERGLRLGLISNTHRSLELFQRHFGLDFLFSSVISSRVHGYMKPHPSIFRAALHRIGATADEALMVGDSMKHDVLGARQVGMGAVLLARSGLVGDLPQEIPVISSLLELPALLATG